MMQAELNEARRLAVAAGAILLEHYSAPPSVEWKAPGDPVTAADRAASAFIVENLERLFPGDAILSEEEPDDLKRLEHSRVWMVDPMDGTREFIAQRGEFAVMIGLVVDGVPAAGVVYGPTTDKLYYGGRGAGAFMTCNGTTIPLQVSSENIASRMTIAVEVEDPQRSQVIKQMNRLINVLQAVDLTDSPAVTRELVLLRIRTPQESRTAVLKEAEIFGAFCKPLITHSIRMRSE